MLYTPAGRIAGAYRDSLPGLYAVPFTWYKSCWWKARPDHVKHGGKSIGMKMKSCLKFITYMVTAAAALPLLAFGIFLYKGSFTLIDFSMNSKTALLLDALLSLLFFLQHSILIRRSVKKRLSGVIPSGYYAAFYAVTSGAALAVMIIFWQRTYPVYYFGTVIKVILNITAVSCIIGFYMGVRALGSFDVFGVEQLKACMNNNHSPGMQQAVIKGPYLLVRHPLYFFSIVLLWSVPGYTADRLLMNILWTIWIVTATFFEERDLVSDFGQTYKEYQASVPMLIPSISGIYRLMKGRM